MQQKRRKRRRMLRERSPSPPVSHSKRTPPLPQLNTRFTPEEMDQAPELEDKKRFLTMFRLSHVTAKQRKGRRCQQMCAGEAGHSYCPLCLLMVWCCSGAFNLFFIKYTTALLLLFSYIVIIVWRCWVKNLTPLPKCPKTSPLRLVHVPVRHLISIKTAKIDCTLI